MKNLQLKAAIIYNFALPALLLNCIGILILNLHVTEHITTFQGSLLEPFKDFSILGGSFFLVSYITKIGYKKTIIAGIILEIIGCLLMALHPTFISAEVYFVFIGASFALIKIAAYSSTMLFTTNEDEHAGFISLLEGFFMAAVLLGFWIFGFFMQTDNWSNAFWLLAIACVVGLVFIIFTPMDETKIQLEKKQPFYKDYKKMLVLLAKFTMWAFLLLAFCYLFIEQGILNFLPIFNVQVLHIPSSASVEVASLLSAGIALGRIMFSFIVKYIHWSKALFICIISALIVLLISLYLTLHISGDAHYTHWNEFPPAAYLLPVVGFMVGPVYPTLCSSILSKQKIEDQSSTTVLIIIFSALGGSAGSILVGAAFNVIGGLQAFAVFMIPLVILLIFVLPYNYLLHNSTGK